MHYWNTIFQYILYCVVFFFFFFLQSLHSFLVYNLLFLKEFIYWLLLPIIPTICTSIQLIFFCILVADNIVRFNMVLISGTCNYHSYFIVNNCLSCLVTYLTYWKSTHLKKISMVDWVVYIFLYLRIVLFLSCSTNHWHEWHLHEITSKFIWFTKLRKSMTED